MVGMRRSVNPGPVYPPTLVFVNLLFFGYFYNLHHKQKSAKRRITSDIVGLNKVFMRVHVLLGLLLFLLLEFQASGCVLITRGGMKLLWTRTSS